MKEKLLVNIKKFFSILKKKFKIIKSEIKKLENLIFLITFIVIMALFKILFFIFSISFIWWLFAVIIFLICLYFMDYILKYSLVIKIIIGIIFIVSMSGLIMITNTKDTVNNNDNDVPRYISLKNLNFKNNYELGNNKGTYDINIKTIDNHYEIELIINANKSIIPSDFVWNNLKADSYIREHITVYKTDMLESFITDGKNYYTHGPLSIETASDGNYNLYIKDIFPCKYVITRNSDESLKEFMNKYNQIEIYRFNVGEVGINNFKSEKADAGGYMGSYGYNSEKAYKLHKIILNTTIPWNDIKTEIGLK